VLTIVLSFATLRAAELAEEDIKGPSRPFVAHRFSKDPGKALHRVGLPNQLKSVVCVLRENMTIAACKDDWQTWIVLPDCLANSKPFMPGIITSEKTRSNAMSSSAKTANASRPEDTRRVL
jgi:hypothetical protein